jgi:protein-tyrosine phosphatase
MKVLFVCMGNICRSPTAQAVVEHLLREQAADVVAEFDSAGTHGYHVGQPPDQRTLSAAAARGYDMASLRARQVTVEDFERFDLILAMDEENLTHLRRLAPSSRHERIRLFLDYAQDDEVREVPDPFYGGDVGFERVLDLVEAAARGLIAELTARR